MKLATHLHLTMALVTCNRTPATVNMGLLPHIPTIARLDVEEPQGGTLDTILGVLQGGTLDTILGVLLGGMLDTILGVHLRVPLGGMLVLLIPLVMMDSVTIKVSVSNGAVIGTSGKRYVVCTDMSVYIL